VHRLAIAGATINVLLEVGYIGGRAGCRSVDAALEVARAVKAAPSLRLRGVEGFEGLHQSLPAHEGAAKVRAFLASMLDVAQHFDRESLFAGDEILLSAGGSAFYDLVCEVFAGAQLSRATSIVLRSGCYFTHDAGVYERSFAQVRDRDATARAVGGRFESALEVWAQVLSTPEPGRAIVGAGRRDYGHDGGMPVVLKRFRPEVDAQPSVIAGCEVVAVNDQHAHVKLEPGVDLKIGDLVALGVSHPCTTFDKWKLIYLVDDGYWVTSAVETFF
jgi:D-serine dehydratase